MISDKHKFIFIHIPKCAGSSIESILLQNENINIDFNKKLPLNSLSLDQQKKYDLGIDSAQHKPNSAYVNYPSYTKFTFIRNPWSRFVSEYEYFKKFNRLDISFSEFVNQVSYLPDMNGTLNISGKKTLRYHFVEQYKFIEGSSIDYIGQFENLHEDFNTIKTKLNIQGELPFLNKSPNEVHYTQYYNDVTKEKVRQLYNMDILKYQYKFK